MRDKNELAFGLSLMIVGLTSIILNVTNLVGINLPDIIRRAVGLISLVAVVILVFNLVKIVKKRKENV